MDSNYILEWIKFADNDLDTAELLIKMRPQHHEIICYHCQQSAEKYLSIRYYIEDYLRCKRLYDLSVEPFLCDTYK